MEINVYYDPQGFQVPAISLVPSGTEVRKARALLDEVLKEFCFCDDDVGIPNGEASRANAMSMLITPFMRRYIRGCTPLYLIEKPAAGAGATLLSTIPQLLFEGRVRGATPYTVDETEMQKVLVSATRDQKSILVFDNVRDFNNRALILVMTQEEISGRVLGSSNIVSRRNNFLWIATGINPGLEGEMARRVCRIRLDPKIEDIQKRNFTRALDRWVIDNRGELVWAILTLIRHWVAAGAKPFTARTLASFEHWASSVGGVLEAVGIEHFLANPRQVSVQSRDFALRRFAKELFGWMAFQPKSFSEILRWLIGIENEMVVGRDDAAKAQAVRAILQEIDHRTFNIPQPVSLSLVRGSEEECYAFTESRSGGE